MLASSCIPAVMIHGRFTVKVVFSCHRLSNKMGFHADKDGDSRLGTHWSELQKWRTSGYPTLYSVGAGFDAAKGKYKILNEGAYYCYAQVRLDDKDRNYARLILARNQEKDNNNGFHSIGGNWGSTNFRSMRLVGNAWFQKGDYVSLFTYSSSDSYTAHSESGFGCHRLASPVGFHADMGHIAALITIRRLRRRPLPTSLAV